ncbi:HAMP domain-containing protein [Azospirillum melinis]|uniref:HAMP domain-containing protein n=1 Tax=Azospirillum melinis TaxID=328839 RepID=A0ABX2KFK0_9PROT|nr:MCP four helix bundle domain-containing protein [Azospirillum melinis]MBP2308485.1 methyl-accepting chemotaxis protein [Azospirillum melinis]NUB01302.1 HAMP domain-containing protein [Azospirillum melinis]
MFKNLKIGKKLAVLVVVLNGFTAIIGLISLHGMKMGNDALDTVYNDRVVPLRDLKVIADLYAVNIVDMAHKARNGNVPTEAALAAIDDARSGIREKWRGYLATYLVDEEKALVAKAEPLMADADRAADRLRGILAAGRSERLDRFVIDELYPAIEPVSDVMSALIELQLTVARSVYQQNDALYDLTVRRTIGLLIGAVLVGVALGVAIIRSITVPLGQARDVIDRMARGDLNVTVADDGRRDEIGHMLRATAGIAATLKAVAGDLRDLIEAARGGALSVRVEPERHAGEFAVLVRGANELVEVLTTPLFEVASVMARLSSGDIRGRMTGSYDGDLRALKGNVNRSIDALALLLDEISGFAGALAQGDVTRTVDGAHQGDFAAIKNNLNSAVEQLAAVLRAVNGSTEQVATSATETAAAAIDVSRQAAGQMMTLADVSGAIEQTAGAIGEIARNAERGSTLARGTADLAEDGQRTLISLSRAVDGIAERTAGIERISALIAGIADKTYVLALNAGLEAVRAGESGRGFGLIAAKISSLAEDVTAATRDIGTLVREASAGVETGVRAAGEAAEAIGRIVEASRDSGSTAQSIAAAIDEQNAMASLLKDRVEQLSMTGQATAGAAEEISATMAALTDMAQRLKAETARIRTA